MIRFALRVNLAQDGLLCLLIYLARFLIYAFLSAISLLLTLQEIRILRALCLQTNRTCFYCSLRLNDIVNPNKSLQIMEIRVFLRLLTGFHKIRINALLPFERCFIAHLNNIYLLFLNIWCPWHMLISIFISADQTKPTKSCSIYLILIKYLSGRFLTFSVMPCLHEINNKKKKILAIL